MLVVSEPVSCRDCVQLVLHQGRAETTFATQNCHPAGAEFGRQFSLCQLTASCPSLDISPQAEIQDEIKWAGVPIHF